MISGESWEGKTEKDDVNFEERILLRLSEKRGGSNERKKSESISKRWGKLKRQGLSGTKRSAMIPQGTTTDAILDE